MTISKDFTNAVEANKVCNALYQEITKNYNRDLHRLLKNITSMVEELSKLEVVARQSRQRYKVDDKIKEIRDAIDYLEKMMLIQKLSA